MFCKKEKSYEKVKEIKLSVYVEYNSKNVLIASIIQL